MTTNTRKSLSRKQISLRRAAMLQVQLYDLMMIEDKRFDRDAAEQRNIWRLLAYEYGRGNAADANVIEALLQKAKQI